MARSNPTFKCSNVRKWVLLVACSEQQAQKAGKDHAKVIEKFFDHAHTLPKAKLVEMRNNMLKEPHNMD